MIRIIAKKELRDILRDGRFRWTSGIVGILLLASLLAGWHYTVSTGTDHNLAQETMREQWLNQGEKNPHSASHLGIYAFRPIPELALVDPGINNYTGTSVWLEAHNRNEFTYRPVRDSVPVARFGELTASVVMQVLIPLIIVFLCFQSISGERENGTLRQIFATGVRSYHFLAGKVIGTAGAILAVLIPATILGTLALVFFTSDGGVQFTDIGIRSVIMGSGYLAYFGVFLGISLGVSAVARSSGMSLLILLAFWMFNCLIVPRVVSDLVRSVYPTPSAQRFQQIIADDMSEGIDGHNPEDKRMDELRERLFTEYGVDSIENLPVNFEGVALQESEDYGNEVYDRRYGELWSQYESQNRLRNLTGMIAPFMALRSVSMGASGTDWYHHKHFAEAAESWRRMMVREMNEALIYESASQNYGDNLRADELWASIPDFDYRSPKTSQIFRVVMFPLILLGIWLVASGAFLFLLSRRLIHQPKL
ncbi:MAG: DUF3526 domain-containing protein [Balneolaceae bacterium]